MFLKHKPAFNITGKMSTKFTRNVFSIQVMDKIRGIIDIEDVKVQKELFNQLSGQHILCQTPGTMEKVNFPNPGWE